MEFYWLLLGVLSVWRITHLLNAEDGPGDVFVRLRRAVGNGFLGKLLDCFNCLSLWIAAPAALFIVQSWPERLFLWLALSAGAILFERITKRDAATQQPALYYEDKETDHVMLRKPEDTVLRDSPPLGAS